jgi:hypothetical protein
LKKPTSFKYFIMISDTHDSSASRHHQATLNNFVRRMLKEELIWISGCLRRHIHMSYAAITSIPKASSKIFSTNSRLTPNCTIKWRWKKKLHNLWLGPFDREEMWDVQN